MAAALSERVEPTFCCIYTPNLRYCSAMGWDIAISLQPQTNYGASQTTLKGLLSPGVKTSFSSGDQIAGA
eukprot:scaffold104841_cov24-Prasinocladus_malaysianus.AAC.2